MHWFHGFKLHLVINDKGEIFNFTIPKPMLMIGKPLNDKSFIRKLYGKLYADKGYIDKRLVLRWNTSYHSNQKQYEEFTNDDF
ncbi:MAG: hypothetical protein CSA39_01270 [Flavobacteriales bacterium]|nr:MAG: hypothetical protein CSA39_01270 [Flavobacteriales bacterium]